MWYNTYYSMLVFKKEGNVAICNNMDESGGHCAMGKRSATKKANTVCIRVHTVSRTVNLTERE